MIKKLTAIVISLFAITSCSTGNSAVIADVDASTFLSKISASGVVLIDVRTPVEFQSGHLKGALNLDVESGAFDSAIAGLDKSVTYAVYCRSGRRSSIAAEKLANAGFVKIVNFNQGGFAELAAAGAITE